MTVLTNRSSVSDCLRHYVKLFTACSIDFVMSSMAALERQKEKKQDKNQVSFPEDRIFKAKKTL